MTSLFIFILNMSITASYVAVAIIIIRLFLKKLPKVFSYVLWSAVLIRLVCPFSFSSAFSFLGFLKPNVQKASGVMQYVSGNIGMANNPSVNFGISSINNAVNPRLPAAIPIASANPMQIILEAAGIIWIIGIAVLFVYSMISYFKLTTNMKTATLLRDNIYETDRISSPFLCGFFKPKIYVPLGISENEMSHILVHEQTHIARLDYLVKPFAFLICILHWFNPLIWLSFALMSKDMEMSCDESVVRKMGNAVKSEYSNSLLSLSLKKSRILSASPLAFGESNIKSRIKNVISYKKPALWLLITVTVLIASLLIAFVANPQKEHDQKLTVNSEYNIEALLVNKTPYVGNNSKVVALIDALPLPQGIFRDTVALQTKKTPYGITINLDMKDDAGIVSNDILNSDVFYRNAILLFALIDNVDIVSYDLTDKTGKSNGAIYGFTYTREMTCKLIGEDVRNFSADTDSLKSLTDRLKTMSFEVKPSPTVPGNEVAEPTVNRVSSTSPNKLFLAENYGVDKGITAGGLYPSEGIHIVDIKSKKVMWDMKLGYYGCAFLWSSDSRYTAVSYTARTEGYLLIVDTNDFSEISVPTPEEVTKRYRSFRPDPYFQAKEWLNDHTVKISFNYTGTDEKIYSGSYVFDCKTGGIGNLYIDTGTLAG